MDRNFLMGLQTWKSCQREQESCLGELLGLKQLRRQQDIPAPAIWTAGARVLGDFYFQK